jgi:hypothetical protein
LLAPLTLATLGAALPPPPRVDRREVARASNGPTAPTATRAPARSRRGSRTRRRASSSAGQQPGLFGGPLLALLKMVAAGRWAEELARAASRRWRSSGWPPRTTTGTSPSWAAVWTPEGERRVDLGPDPSPLVPLGMRTLGPASPRL